MNFHHFFIFFCGFLETEVCGTKSDARFGLSGSKLVGKTQMPIKVSKNGFLGPISVKKLVIFAKICWNSLSKIEKLDFKPFFLATFRGVAENCSLKSGWNKFRAKEIGYSLNLHIRNAREEVGKAICSQVSAFEIVLDVRIVGWYLRFKDVAKPKLGGAIPRQ
jgi:hypothetical protein